MASSASSSPTTRSPAKYRPCRDLHPGNNANSHMEMSGSPSQAPLVPKQVDLIVSFPTINQPCVSDTMPKEMLLSLCLLCKYVADVQGLKDRINQVEDSRVVFTTSFNTMVDIHEAHTEEIAWLKAKVIDLEDRFRCNNFKTQSIPELVQSLQLPHYVRDIFHALISLLTSSDLEIDRVLRLPKSCFMP